jgi:hypothetical protein
MKNIYFSFARWFYSFVERGIITSWFFLSHEPFSAGLLACEQDGFTILVVRIRVFPPFVAQTFLLNVKTKLEEVSLFCFFVPNQ